MKNYDLTWCYIDDKLIYSISNNPNITKGLSREEFNKTSKEILKDRNISDLYFIGGYSVTKNRYKKYKMRKRLK